MRRAALAALMLCGAEPVSALEPPRVVITPVGPERVLFSALRDACDGHDVPDAPLRAYRRDDGRLVAFALHFENRALVGSGPDDLKVECRVVFRGAGGAEPEAFDDRAWIAALWTEDGRRIEALVHHEFQANTHPGRCAFPEYIRCWWNAALAVHSVDGGRSFAKRSAAVVARTPFAQDVGQGRHRGFFNPSGIVRHDGRLHVLIGTTGWSAREGGFAQSAGVCLFRTDDMSRPERWRAFDGKGFAARFDRSGGRACALVGPFPAPVGALVRHRPSGAFIALYQAKAGMRDNAGGAHAVSGFYASASRDLIAWSAPTLVRQTPTLYDDGCPKDQIARNYPSLVDFSAPGPTLTDIGEVADLTFARLRLENCRYTSDRDLIAVKARIAVLD